MEMCVGIVGEEEWEPGYGANEWILEPSLRVCK